MAAPSWAGCALLVLATLAGVVALHFAQNPGVAVGGAMMWMKLDATSASAVEEPRAPAEPVPAPPTTSVVSGSFADALVSSGCPATCSERLRALHSGSLGSGRRWPVLIGGVGDSGTRALVRLLKWAGFDFGRKSYTSDSIPWMSFYDVESCLEPGHVDSVGASTVYEALLPRMHNFSYSLEEARADGLEETFWSGVSFVLMMLRQQLSTCAEDHDHWGIKHPRMSLFLPWLHYVLGDELRYIHVVRDARDLTGGGPQIFYKQLCRYFSDAPKDALSLNTPDGARGGDGNLDGNRDVNRDPGRRALSTCNGRTASRISFNSRWNLDATSWLRRELKPHQYLIVRTEDLVSGNAACMRRVIDFAASASGGAGTVDIAADDLARKAGLFAQHAGSYGGAKFAAEDRKALNRAALRSRAALEAMLVFGYSEPTLDTLADAWPATETDTCGARFLAL